MAKKKSTGFWILVIALIIAVVAGIVLKAAPTGWLASLLVLLGLVIGFLVKPKEAMPFFVAMICFVVVLYLGAAVLGAARGGTYLTAIFNSILQIVVPLVAIAALKELYTTAEA